MQYFVVVLFVIIAIFFLYINRYIQCWTNFYEIYLDFDFDFTSKVECV